MSRRKVAAADKLRARNGRKLHVQRKLRLPHRPRRERLAALHELVERSAHRAELRRVGRMLRNGRHERLHRRPILLGAGRLEMLLQAVQRAALPQIVGGGGMNCTLSSRTETF